MEKFPKEFLDLPLSVFSREKPFPFGLDGLDVLKLRLGIEQGNEVFKAGYLAFFPDPQYLLFRGTGVRFGSVDHQKGQEVLVCPGFGFGMHKIVFLTLVR